VKQKWAVVIGTAKFKEKRLNGDEQSMDAAAKQFYDYLLDDQGGRFAPSHVKLLLNSEATRQNIMSTLGHSWLANLAGQDDLVVVFIATSSFATTDGGTYLCAHDCALDNIYSTCISMQDLMGSMRKEIKSDRILLVLQACYSGAAKLDTGAKALFSGYNIDLDRVVLGKGYVILSSSGSDEITWNDVFSRHLVQALRQQNGLIKLQDAFMEARKATEEETARQGLAKKQTPQMKSDWSGNDLVLGAPPVEQVSQLPSEVMNFLSAEAYYLQATNEVNKGNLDEAIRQYEKALTIDPNYADALGDYGAVLALKGQLNQALVPYRKAIAARPGDGVFHANYARILDRLGSGEESLKELKLAYQCNPKDRIVLTALSNKELQSGNPREAIKLLREAIALYPNSGTLHERLGCALAQSGDVDAALSEARLAAKLEPTSPSAKLNLGSILMLHGELQEAISSYKQVVADVPANADAHLLMSKALEASGDRANASCELAQFLKLANVADPRAVDARRHLTELSPAVLNPPSQH
jgi:Flp pilus assembly protein TadD